MNERREKDSDEGLGEDGEEEFFLLVIRKFYFLR